MSLPSASRLLALLLPLALTACRDDGAKSGDDGTIGSDGGTIVDDTGVETGDGGTTDGGTSDGGTSDGGTTDGGDTDGGDTDGGTETDGGTSDGGTTDGGDTDGGTSDGGDTDGGDTDGGDTDGGDTDGGTSDGGDTDPGPDPVEASDGYLLNRVMVSVEDGVDIDDVADDYDCYVIRDAGPAGFAVLDVPAGGDLADHLEDLRADSRVDDGARIGTYAGADDDPWEGRGGSHVTSQWHLSYLSLPEDAEDLPSVSGVVVAVLDTGVAYTDTTDDSGVVHVAADGLVGVDIVAPYDFVNDDEHPGDDHQHGTHIASLIASTGSVEGVAYGASLMPVKVLDEDNAGWEVYLLDGLRHAIDNGAQVINLSLAFDGSYAPSRPLLELLQDAQDAGIIVVGAAGNDGATRVSWPAASPSVIAVGATTVGEEDIDQKTLQAAGYSNTHTGVDIMAPGGDLDADRNLDGQADGLLAETISPGDPGEVGYWLMAGTSQAAALVSGAAALYVADGGDPDYFAGALHLAAQDKLEDSTIELYDGHGAGTMRVRQTLNKADDGAFDHGHEYGVAVLPYLQDNGDGTVTPMARLTAFDVANDGPSGEAKLLGRFDGTTSGAFECSPNGDGVCLASGPDVTADEDTVLSWTVSVDAAENHGILFRPTTVVIAGDTLDDVLGELDESADGPAALGVLWTTDQHVELGDLIASVAIPATGSGLASSPMGSLVTVPVLEDDFAFTETTLSLTSGDSSTLTLLELSGRGLASSPMGSLRGRVGLVQGEGLASSPMGTAFSIFAPDDDSTTMMLADGSTFVGDASSSIGDWFEGGGAVNEDGYTGPRLLIGGGLISPPAASGAGTGDVAEWSGSSGGD